MSDDLSGVTTEQVAEIFTAVENQVSELRSAQGSQRLLKIGGLVTLCTALATSASVALASLGFKWIGPPAEIAAVKENVAAVKISVDTLRDQVDSIVAVRTRNKYESDAKLAQITVMLDQTQFLVCILLKRQDQTIVPKECK